LAFGEVLKENLYRNNGATTLLEVHLYEQRMRNPIHSKAYIFKAFLDDR